MSQSSFLNNKSCKSRRIFKFPSLTRSDYPNNSLLSNESPANFFVNQKKTIENLTSKLGDFSNLFTKMPPLAQIKKEIRYHTKRLYFHRLNESSKWYVSISFPTYNNH